MKQPNPLYSQSKTALQSGFTMVELMITIVIVGILSAIALPVFLNQQHKARAACAQTQVSALAREQQIFFSQNNKFAATYQELGATAPEACGGYNAVLLGAGLVNAIPKDRVNGYCVSAILRNGTYALVTSKQGCEGG